MKIVDKCESGKDGLYIPEKILGEGFLIKIKNFERSFYDGSCIDAVRFNPFYIFTKFDCGVLRVGE